MAAPWPFRGNKGDNYTKINASTVETPIVLGYTEKFANLTQLVLGNSSATACLVTIREAVGGAIRLVAKVSANATVVIGNGEDAFLEDHAMGQPWTATCESVDSIHITASFKYDN